MDTHPAFGEALRRAKAAGVRILARDCRVTADSIVMDEAVPVVLGSPEAERGSGTPCALVPGT